MQSELNKTLLELSEQSIHILFSALKAKSREELERVADMAFGDEFSELKSDFVKEAKRIHRWT